MANSPIDLGPLILVAVFGVIGCGAILAGSMIFGARHVIESAKTREGIDPARIAEQRASAEPPTRLDIHVEASAVRRVVTAKPQDEVIAWFGVTSKLFSAAATEPERVVVQAQTWRFVRATGLPDEPDALIAARVCPNCGAPLGASASGVCLFCHQVLVGNAHGWLVAGTESGDLA